MNELRLTRVYQAPRALVWKVWTDPAHVAHWWGPRGFTLTHHSKELRAGGHWNYTMHGPDGTDFPNHTVYHEVVEEEKLVYDHGSDGTSPPLFRVTVTFSDVADGTQMDMVMAFTSAEAAKAAGEAIKKHGGNSTWDRLAEYLEKEVSGNDCFVIHRSFKAPADLLFQLWTQPEHLAAWLPPAGATMQYVEVDIRPGGSSFYRMDHPGGTMWGKAEYHEIEPPTLLTYTQMFSDENRGMGRHPMMPTFPEKMHTTVKFTPEGANQTRVCITWRPTGEVSAEEWAAFIAARSGMTTGWTGSLDKLDGYLEEFLFKGAAG